MPDRQLDSGRIAFQTEGRLLQELGERLVASPQVALVELIKNSYDADATACRVTLPNDQNLIVRDDGAGMTFEQFATRWMRIATSNKSDRQTSPNFKRNLTGQKGIGRFAVRSLGRSLHLESVAEDPKRKCKTRLIADFDWAELDAQESLDDAKIPYRLFRAGDEVPIGTSLTLKTLNSDAEFVRSTSFRTAVLNIVSPLRALEGGRLRAVSATSKRDPGFKVTLPGDSNSVGDEVNLAEKILSHSWARLSIDLTKDRLEYSVTFSKTNRTSRLKTHIDSLIKNGIVADIRFFPRRAGVFKSSEVNGQQAWKWVRNQHGIAVVDRGFRIQPYGMEDDDWLRLDADSAHNERDWRSSISKAKYPIPAVLKHRGENPMLNLPSNFQVVGAVFVKSSGAGKRGDDDLVTAMDREGFLSNAAFEQLVDIVRGGIEFLANKDRSEMQREAQRKSKEAKRRLRADLRAAVDYIEQSPTLTRRDKSRLVQEYAGLADRIDEAEEYDQEARRKLETMSALGVVAGFMTHETARIISGLKEALAILEKAAKTIPSLQDSAGVVRDAYSALEAHLDYARIFIDATQHGRVSAFDADPQIKLVIEKFGSFANQRAIDIELEIDPSAKVPSMPIAVYSGVLLNLYTNALKAIVANHETSREPKILFRAHNDGRWHVVEVLDTGIGIPPNLRNRVWGPPFTTTSRLNNPLGPGMGLGLPLIRELVEQVGGRVEIVDSPKGYTTCFRVQFPLKKS